MVISILGLPSTHYPLPSSFLLYFDLDVCVVDKARERKLMLIIVPCILGTNPLDRTCRGSPIHHTSLSSSAFQVLATMIHFLRV
jgi:hypothetical protein